jgi:hypothetical protein
LADPDLTGTVLKKKKKKTDKNNMSPLWRGDIINRMKFHIKLMRSTYLFSHNAIYECKTNTLPILMHQMCISTTQDFSVMLRSKKLVVIIFCCQTWSHILIKFPFATFERWKQWLFFFDYHFHKLHVFLCISVYHFLLNILSSSIIVYNAEWIIEVSTRCVVNATNAPALSQSFKTMFNLFQFQGG